MKTLKGIVVVASLFGIYAIVSINESTYKMDAEVTEVNDEEVVVVDATENEWVFYGDGYKVGQNVKITFDNNHTDNIRKDDLIIKVQNAE